jgi:hypothetical protein
MWTGVWTNLDYNQMYSSVKYKALYLVCKLREFWMFGSYLCSWIEKEHLTQEKGRMFVQDVSQEGVDAR